jgi:hypothetical protein
MRRLWRGDATVQLGADPEHGLVLDGLTEPAANVLSLLDGTRDRRQVVAAAATAGTREDDVRGLLDLLRSVAALDDADARPERLDPAERARLAPDLASLTLLATAPGEGVAQLERRRAASVLVVGAGRVGSLVAALLGAAGVGHVAIRDERVAEAGDAVPGGVLPEDDGQPRALAAMDAARRAGAASVDGALRPPDAADCAAAEFAVVAADGWLVPPAAVLDVLGAAGLSYLVAGVRETYGAVGPLVVPGRTSCPRCHDLHRAARDPDWPLLAAQLASDRHEGVVACDVTLAAGVAALAAGQVLSHLAAPGLARAVDATIELRLPEWTVRRRPWTAHPDCPCGAAPGAAGVGPPRAAPGAAGGGPSRAAPGAATGAAQRGAPRAGGAGGMAGRDVGTSARVAGREARAAPRC